MDSLSPPPCGEVDLAARSADKSGGGQSQKPKTRHPARSCSPTSPPRGGEFGIYIHWPFCAAKCPYCDFNSHVRQVFDEDAWVSGIVRELHYVAELQSAQRRTVETIFFGGGTPSLMRGRSTAAVLETIVALWPVSPDVEITLEANPASVEAARFRDYRAAGINRLSLGVQALNDAALKALGRLHNAAEAKSALAVATKTFERVSFDLIYARPHQTLADWRDELAGAVAFGTEHLSLYQLTIEPATPFATLARTGALVVPGDDAAAELYEVTQKIAESAGLPAYEISNHARAGAECRHNLLYWRYGDYAGVGPGAHGRITVDGRRIATSTERLPERWRQRIETTGHGFVEWSEVSAEVSADEHLLMALRLTEGLDTAEYDRRWGVGLNEDRVASLAADGLLSIADGRIRATPRGRLVLNRLIAELAP
ncbi:MAG: coproporphyrinogen III oxidase [Alphaproteobacteria bacterium]|nr:coproporphyrinogen III oxidase [Alphaproteobacteria bacterium]